LYTKWMGTLSCYGSNVTTFPRVHTSVRQTVGHIDVIQTNLSTLPHLNGEDWPMLSTMDVRDNAALQCDSVSKLRASLPQVLIASDCHSVLSDQKYVIPEDAWSAFIIVLPLVIIGLVGGFWGRNKCKDRKRVKSLSVQRAEECTPL
jgi:hypothetical protein